MLRDYRKIARIAYILIVVSIVLFAVSGVILTTNSEMHRTEIISANGSVSMNYNASIQVGDLIFYTLSSNQSSANLTSYILQSHSLRTGYANLTGSGSVTREYVSGSSGNISLVVVNNSNESSNASVSIERISYTVIYTIVFGLAFLPSGLILLVAAFRIRNRERPISNRQRDFD